MVKSMWWKEVILLGKAAIETQSLGSSCNQETAMNWNWKRYFSSYKPGFIFRQLFLLLLSGGCLHIRTTKSCPLLVCPCQALPAIAAKGSSQAVVTQQPPVATGPALWQLVASPHTTKSLWSSCGTGRQKCFSLKGQQQVTSGGIALDKKKLAT